MGCFQRQVDVIYEYSDISIAVDLTPNAQLLLKRKPADELLVT